MRNIPSLKPALLVASGISVFCFLVSIFFYLPIWKCLAMSVAVFIVAFICIMAAIQYFLLRRVDAINTLITDALESTGFEENMEKTGQSSLPALENAVKHLITAQRTEIGHLKELERMRKEFLGDVAHELRSPIFNIQGYIHTLIEGALEDTEVSSKFLAKAAKHVDHLSSLVEDLVTISRIESGDMKLEFADFDIKELIKEVVDLQDLPAKSKNIVLQNKFNDKAVFVRADRPKIRQVLNNLIGNSIKYGKENGHTIIDIEEQPGIITIKIADNGEGIAKEHLPRIFERFYRVDKARARTIPSTGLGLAIAKHFTEAHGNKIFATSREGVGSIFSFSLQKV